MKSTAALAAALLLCTSAIADELDLSFNEDAFRIVYARDFDTNDLSWDAGFLNHSDNGWIINGSLYLSGFASDGVNPLEAGLGIRTGWVDGDNSGQNGVPFAPGGYLKYTLPNYNRISIRADVYYAPDVLTVDDLEAYKDYSIRVSYNLLREADIYVGARYVKGEFDNDTSQRFDTGMNLGVNLRF
ncbi:MAG: YfaZ family outer membrane protein [Gammaproteobacteria bacterium]